MRRRNWLFAHFREVARRFAFEEVDAPVVEHTDLFTRKAGEEIVEQLYHFELHGRHLALRPELTPSLMRMATARLGALPLPLRWFAIGQNWRYERSTRGRRREHYQWDLEILGEPGVAAEAELLAALFALFEAVGLAEGDVAVRVNSRALLEETLRASALRGRPEAFAPLCVIIDKLAKIGADAVVDLLCEATGPVALERSAAREVVDRLSLRDLAEAARDAAPDSAALRELERLFELAAAYGFAPQLRFDASVVRGLAYYTGIVFEGFDTGGTLRSVCGGGRYDRLGETLGGRPLPAVGFGLGDVVLLELLAELERLPELPRDLDDIVFPLGAAERPAALALARRLRRHGRAVAVVLDSPRLRRVLRDAHRAGAQRLLVLGPDEAARGVVQVRDLETGREREEALPNGG